MTEITSDRCRIPDLGSGKNFSHLGQNREAMFEPTVGFNGGNGGQSANACLLFILMDVTEIVKIR